MEGQQGGFTILKWNGSYGQDSKFIVRDNHTGKQSVFTPGRTQDLVWTGTDLAGSLDFKDWQDFNEETVQDLDEVAF